MAFSPKWVDNSDLTTIALPREIKPAGFALALLLDQRDAELLDFLESRFIPLPPARQSLKSPQTIEGVEL